MGKSKRIVIISVIVLLLAVVVLWFLNGGGANRAGTDAVISFAVDGEVVAEADMEYVKSMEGKTFKTVIRSSGKKPEEAEYTGVLLKDLLDDRNVNPDGKKQILIKGIDGYMTALSVSELEDEKIYIAYELNGEALKSKEKNGNGPFQLVIPSDPFSQRWCKFVCEVEVK